MKFKAAPSTVIGRQYKVLDTSYSFCITDNPTRASYVYNNYRLNGQPDDNMGLANIQDELPICTIISEPFYAYMYTRYTNASVYKLLIIVQDPSYKAHIVMFRREWIIN